MVVPSYKLSGVEKVTDVVFVHIIVDHGYHFQRNLAWRLKSR
jgi:hypothetical protein